MNLPLWLNQLILYCMFLGALSFADANGKKTAIRKRMEEIRAKETQCDIHKSTAARRILAKAFYPVFDAENVPLPLSCPLNNTRDLFYEFELLKNYQITARWKCEACGKAFYTEHFLDLHFLEKHRDILEKRRDFVCLADFCDILRCELHQSYPDIPEKIECNDKVTLSLQRSCEKLIRDCLPAGPDVHRLYDAASQTLCSSLTCEKFLTPFQDSFSIWTVVLLSMAVPALIITLGSLCFYFLDLVEHEEVDFSQSRKSPDHPEYENTYEHVVKQRGSRLRHRNLIHGDPYSSDLSRTNRRWNGGHAYCPVSSVGDHRSLLEPVESEAISSQRDWFAIDIG